MFVQLNPLVQACGKLTLTLFAGKDGVMKVSVVPAGDSKEAALSTPLTLSAMPAELDDGFAEAVTAYQSSRMSLAAQVEATTAILNDAKQKQTTKAVQTLKGKPPAKASGSESKNDSDLVDDADLNTGSGGDSGTSVNPVSTTPAAPASTGTDLGSLI